MDTGLWSIYNQDTGQQIDGLTLEQAQAIFAALEVADRVCWLVWCEGWSDWKPMSETHEIRKIRTRTMKQGPPTANQTELTPGLETSETLEAGVSTITYEVKGKASPDPVPESRSEGEQSEISRTYSKRAFRRLNRSFPVEIECAGKLFKTVSVNVSAGGVLLRDPLPDWVVGYSVVKIIRPDKGKAVKLTCSIVENQDPDQRYRIEFATDDDDVDVKKLQAWLAA